MTAPDYFIKARHVRFDWKDTPIQWTPGDPSSTHITSILNLLFPAGKLWFCRVYNKALPLIIDVKLRADAEGFLRQEAVHSCSHGDVLTHYYKDHGIDTQPFTERLDWLFSEILGEQPLGLKIGHTRFWLQQQLGTIAALEHFFGYLGNWVFNAKGLDAVHADPIMLDLLRQHGAEEVEHRTITFDIFRRMGGSYLEHCFHILTAILLLLYFLVTGFGFMYQHDPGVGRFPNFIRSWWHGPWRNCLPSLWKTLGAALRYFRSSYMPHHEGSTEQALAYLEISPAAQAAAHGGNWVRDRA